MLEEECQDALYKLIHEATRVGKVIYFGGGGQAVLPLINIGGILQILMFLAG